MNDRYLYRAKRKNWRELPKEMWWIEGYYAYFKQNDNHCIYYETDGFTLVCDIDISTLCACTGLKDKNGKLIWENDIVQELFGNTFAPIKYGSYQSCFDSAKTEHVGFYVDWSVTKEPNMRKDLGYWIHMVDAEIVGNTFDNPELLKVYN